MKTAEEFLHCGNDLMAKENREDRSKAIASRLFYFLIQTRISPGSRLAQE